MHHTRAILQQDGPDHLGLWLNQVALRDNAAASSAGRTRHRVVNQKLGNWIVSQLPFSNIHTHTTIKANNNHREHQNPPAPHPSGLRAAVWGKAFGHPQQRVRLGVPTS